MANATLRKTAVVVAVLAAIAVPAAQAVLGFGLSAARFSYGGDQTLRAAPYAFSIWGLIYLGLIAYAIFQLRARETPAVVAFGWPSALAAASCAVWILASAFDMKAASVVIILTGAAAAISPLLKRPAPNTGLERTLVIWPNALLAGWLTIATALNVLTVFTGWQVITPGTAQPAALAALGIVALVAISVSLRAKSAIYLLPIVWGLAAVYVAESADKPLVARVAAGAAVALLAVAGVAAFGKPGTAAVQRGA